MRYSQLAITAPKGYAWQNARFLTHHSFARLRQLGTGEPIRQKCSWGHTAGIQIVHCQQHRRDEFVPVGNWQDLRPWYEAGRHPRYSITKMLLQAKQPMFLIDRLLGGSALVFALKTNKAARRSPTALRRAIRHLLSTHIRFQRRSVRVDQAFATKYRRKAFTVQDWFAEDNQERRRMMLRNGVVPADLEAKLGQPIAEDAEGKLYLYRDPHQWDPPRRFLAVECPSTHERYLLQVPEYDNTHLGQIRAAHDEAVNQKYAGQDSWQYRFNQLPETERIERAKPALLDTPAKARRWTFRLPMDAEFAAEA